LKIRVCVLWKKCHSAISAGVRTDFRVGHGCVLGGAVSCMSLAYEFLADERRGYTLCNGNSRIRAFFLIIELLKRVAPRPFLGARLEQRLSR
jgi:hypothetical protein